MHHRITTNAPVHPLLLERWSPKEFTHQPVPADILETLFEAARLAPSCFNEQPWHFIAATKDDPAFYQQVLGCFETDNQAWAQTAPVLIIAVTKLYFTRNGVPNVYAWHDMGFAIANLTLQAVSEGLQVCEAAGIDHEKIYRGFALPEGYQPVVGIAVGYAGNGAGLSPELLEKHRRVRTRKEVSEFVHYAAPVLEMDLAEPQKKVYSTLKAHFPFGDLRPGIAFAKQALDRH